MPLVVNTNVSSLLAQRNLTNNTSAVNKSIERLSSGYRINRAADDSAGLTISETLRGNVRGLKVALQNAQDGISILQIAEGTLSVVSENLQRIRELTVQAANDTNSTDQRGAIVQEIQTRLRDNERIVQASQFNGIKLLDGSATNARLHIGYGAESTLNTLNISSALASSDSTALTLLGSSSKFQAISSISFQSGNDARNFLLDLDKSIGKVSSRRSLIGAYQNQLDSSIQNISLGLENFTSSESRIRDLDVAAESANLTKNQILQQASVSILSQANQIPNLVLKLLQ
jgi:flagellin